MPVKKKYDRAKDLQFNGLQEVNGKFADITRVNPTKLDTYTAFITWDGEEIEEEIDVLAANEAEARKVTHKALTIILVVKLNTLNKGLACFSDSLDIA